MDYLAIPFKLKEDYLARADSLEESLLYSVGLLLSSRPGSMEFLPEFGTAVWELEFSDLQTANKADVRASLRNAISKFEKRLYNVSVSFQSTDTMASQSLGMMVKVTGNYREDGDEKKFEGNFHLG